MSELGSCREGWLLYGDRPSYEASKFQKINVFEEPDGGDRECTFKKKSQKMYDAELFAAARKDFLTHFGNCEEPIVKKEVMGGIEVIVVETSKKRVCYSMKIELLNVENL